MEHTAIYGQCRCCLSFGYHKNMMKEYDDNSERETYIDMFLECFNLFLSTNNEMSCLICLSCVEELRRANTFRTMVVSNEQKLLAMKSNKDMIYVNLPRTLEMDIDVKRECSPTVKMEIIEEGDYLGTEMNDNDTDCSFTCDSSEYQDETASSSEGPIEGEAELLARFPDPKKLPSRNSLYSSPCAGYAKQLDILRGKIILPKMLKDLVEDSESQSKLGKKIYITEKVAQILNTSTLLENSNVTPFKSRNRFGFPCFFCRSNFDNLKGMKDHQFKVHTKTDIKKTLSTFGAECLVVYVDITDLKCILCDQNIPNLNELKTHLMRVHKKKFYPEFTDRVIPFKLFQEKAHKYECQICGFCFETFGSIERHMNVHYRNYVCKECGTGFVTKYRLKVHTKSMHVGGAYPCDVCKKVFASQQKHKNHVDTVHKMVKRFKCPQCAERFSEYFRRQKHIVEVHNGAPLQYKCNVCDKSFDRRYTLSRHMKRDHLEERDFHCHLCSYKCFTKNELRVHMVKHNGERIFECSVCHKSYARKKTLREHMRIHNNDRRFSCAVCGQAFVQKCSLKGHIKTHHGDYNLPV